MATKLDFSDFEPIDPSEYGGSGLDLSGFEDLDAGLGVTEVSPDDLMNAPLIPPEQRTHPAPEQADTDFQGLYEIPKGVIPGAVSAGGVALKGLSAVAGPADEYRAIIDEIGAVEPGSDQAVSGLRARTFGRDLSPTQRTGLRHALSAKLRGDSEPLQKLIERLPKPVTERALYRAGERVQSWGDKLMPAAPGYEASFGRQVGEGLGSLGAGVAASVIGGPITAGALFTAMGAGEAAERAIEAGASDEEVVRAAALGVGAGSTDIVPVEVLLGRLPVPGVRALAQAVRAVGGAEGAKAIGRIGVQAAVEGVQEGGQEFLQNVIAREVHSPDTVLAEGVLPGAGVGSAVGGIAGIGREGAMALFRRRSRSGRGVRAKAAEAIPEPTPEDEASPIPTETIQEGRRVVVDADATAAADNILAAEGMPRVGTPVRVRVGQRSYEGIVTDAWGEAETAGISVTERDGTVIDSDLQELHDIGAELDILPTEYVDMDPELASVRAQTEALEAEATAQELDAAEAVIAEATQGLADLEAAETSLPTGQEEGTTGAPLLTPTEAARVAELARDGMAPEQAVEQVVAEKQDRAIPAEETEPAAVPDGGFPVSTTPVDADGGDQAGPSLPSDPQLTQDEVDEAADTSDLEGFEPVETETGEGWAPEPTAAGEDVAFGEEGPMGGTAAPEETIPRDDAEQGEAAPEPAPEPERIVKKDGTPFKSKGAASLVAKSKKLTDFEVVEVEGGYAIDSRPQTPVADEVDEGAPTGEPPAGASRATDEAAFEDEDTRPRPPIEEVDPLTLEVDPQAFQYKEGGDASGVTERLRGIKRWDQLKSGVAYVWERADGKRFIADGHQRVGLAKRLADQNPRLDVRIFKETDGYTPADLRERAAAKNIAEGSGTGWDAATVLRESNNPDSLMETLPPNSAIVRDARGLAKLDDELFAAAKADPDANPGHWAVIGEIGEGDRALQDLLVTSFRARKPKSIREAELQARLIQADRLENESQQSLFGSEDVAQSLYAEKARIMDTAIRRLSQDKRVFATLDRHATTIEAAGNRLTAGNSAIAQEAGQAAALVQQLGTMRGPVADVLSRAALEMKDGGTLEGAVRQFTEAVKSWDPIAGRQAGEVDDGGGREVPRGEAEEDTGGEAREPTAAELEAAGQQTFFQRDRLAALTGTPEDFAIAEEAMMQRARGDRATADLFGEDLHSQPPMDFGLFAQGEGAPKPPPAPKPKPETEVKPKTQTPDGTLDLFGTEPPADMKPVEPKKAPRRKRKTDPDIQDFGEKIEGARKDLFRELASTFDKSEAVDIATSPLSKSFPQLNYEKMLEAGHDRQRLMLYAVLRSAIPNKPRDRYYLRGWTESVETVRGEARRVMDPDVPLETIEAEVGAGPMATAEMLVDLEPKDWIQATKFRLTETQLRREQGIPWQLHERGNPWYRDAYRTRDEAIRQGRDEVRGYIERQAAEKKGRSKYTKMSVYRNRKTEELYIGFRANRQVHRLKAGFADVQSAYEYIEANKDDLQAKIDQMRRGPEMRQGENRVRKGRKYRDADVSPEQFGDMFGFRGVQFGNYVEGKRRQQDINEAYDALMDMADAIGIPPRAVSLDGKLALAFGARGGGGGRSGAKAHYEPDQIVINLTKTAGPGSLAHEWLHALDNNFGRRTGREWLSERGEAAGDMRPEVVAAWDATMNAIMASPFRARSVELDSVRSKPYWGTRIEMAARSFERYIHDRLAASGFQNDYLVNINLEGGAYPTAEEMRDSGISDGFNKLFETVESRATDTGGQILYQRDRGDTATGDLFAEPATPAAPATPARKPVSDTDATLARMRTKGPVNFTKPYVGKTGAKLVGYEWVWTPIEIVDRRGEDRVLRVSDWERSITNPETNRQIVHHFFIETVNGEEREVSAETAAKLLGVTQSTVRRSAKKLLERAIAEAREEEAAVAYGEDLAQAQGYASPAAAIIEGTRIPRVTYHGVVFERERNDARWWEGRGDTNIRGREELSFLEKDGRYLFSPGPFGAKDKEEMARRGWREVKIPRFRVFPKDGGEMLYQTAWHASPHEFDNFSTEHIGTGEGHQAYGWGLYFAESKDVADWYSKNFEDRAHDVEVRGEKVDFKDPANFWLRLIDRRMKEEGYSFAEAKANIIDNADKKIKFLESFGEPDEVEHWRQAISAMETLESADDLRVTKKGRTYRVDLAPKENEYLLWDKPLDQQPEPVKRAIEAQSDDFSPDIARGFWEDWGGVSGMAYYGNLVVRNRDSKRAASEELHRHGIRGIKYLDGMSRNRPLREIKREFLDQLPEDSDIADVEALIGTGAFSPQYDAVLKALQADDWLGFDYPSQAISAALSDNIRNWDASDALIEAVEAVKSQGTHNYVIFDESDVAIEEIMLQRRRGRQAPSAEGRARVRPTRRFNAAKLAIRAEIETLGKRAFGDNFNVRVADQIVTPEGDFATGAFDPNARVAYIALRDKADMTGTLYHEGLHYLRRAGAFTKKDGTPTASWKALEAEAPKWREKYRIDERYPAGSTEDLLIEEAIAEAIDDYTKNGPGDMPGKVKLAMDRVLAFFRRLGNVMRGRGFQTATDIFEGLQAGDFQTADGTPDAAAMDRYLQTAWHGSPHEFDQFTTDAIGTGEGAQAYGWGLYFTDTEAVADMYRAKLSVGQTVLLDGEPIGETFGQDSRIPTSERIASDLGVSWVRSQAFVDHLNDSTSARPKNVETALAAQERLAEKTTDPHVRREAQEFVQKARGRLDARPIGRKYKVDIAPKDNEYLLWDRPLKLQPKKVRDYARLLWEYAGTEIVDRVSAEEKPDVLDRGTSDGIRFSHKVAFMISRTKDDENPVTWAWWVSHQDRPTESPEWKTGTVQQAKMALSKGMTEHLNDPSITGEELYRNAIQITGGPREASMSMLEHGIRGNKYLDGMSRSDGKGSYNYVIFDESDVAIEEVQFQRGQGPLADVNDPRVRNYMRDSYATVGEQKGADPVVIWSGTRGGFFETWTPPNDYDRERAAVWGTTNRTVAASYGEDRIMEPPDPSTSGPVRADPEQVRESMEMDVDGLISFEMKWVRAHNQAGLLQPHPPRLPDAPLPFTVDDWVDAVRSSETPADVINERFPATKEDPVAKEFLQILEEELAGNLYQARRRQKWEQGNRAGMYPLVMNLQNPLVVDANGNYWDEIKRDDAEFTAPARGNETVSFSLDYLMTTEQITNAAKAEGFDGVIIKNVVDTADDIVNEPADVYVAFRPEQAKDLRAERFDEFEANMFLQRANPTERPLDFGLSGQAPAQFQLADDVKASAERFGAGGPVATQIAELLQPLVEAAYDEKGFARRAQDEVFEARAIPGSKEEKEDGLRELINSVRGGWIDSFPYRDFLSGIEHGDETVEVTFNASKNRYYPVVGQALSLPSASKFVPIADMSRPRITLSVDDIFISGGQAVFSPKPLRDAFQDLETWYEGHAGKPYERAGLSIDSPALREFMKGSYATANGERGGRPEVIYSGTHAGFFETFEPPDERDKRRAVAWGSTDIEVAATYSNGAKKFLTNKDVALNNNPEWLAGFAEDEHRLELAGSDESAALFPDEWHATASDFSEVDDQSPPPFTVDDWLNALKDADYKVDNAVAAMAERFTSEPEKAFAKNLGEIFLNEVNDIAYSVGGTSGVYPLVMNMENPLVVHAHGKKWNRVSFENDEDFDAPGSAEDKDVVRGRIHRELFGQGSAVTTSTSDIAYAAKNAGFDGVIFRNVRDTADNTDQLGDVFLVYESNQIKDLRAKEFDRSSPNIFYQRGERRLGEFTTEPGAEGIDQAVIPGAERVSDRELVERRMREPMGPKANQRPLDFGLFGDETDKDQLSLFDDDDDGQTTVPVQGGLFQLADDVKASAARFGAGGPVASQIAEELQPILESAEDDKSFAARAQDEVRAARAIPGTKEERADALRELLQNMERGLVDSFIYSSFLKGIKHGDETVDVWVRLQDGQDHPVVGQTVFLPSETRSWRKNDVTRPRIKLSIDDVFISGAQAVYSPKPLRDAFKDLATWYEEQGGAPYERAGLTLDVPALREFTKNSYATVNGDKGSTPEVIYSGTRAGYFTTFDPPDERDKRRAVAWGSTDINVAATYSSLSKKFLTPDDANPLNSREWREGYAEETYRADLEGDEDTASLFDFGWRIGYQVSPESFEIPPPPFTIDEWIDTLKEADYQEEAAQAAMIERYPAAENFVRFLAGAYSEKMSDIVMSSGNSSGIYPLVMNMENPLVIHAVKRKWNRIISLEDNEGFDAPGSTEDKDALRRRLQKEVFGRSDPTPEEKAAFDAQIKAAQRKRADADQIREQAESEVRARNKEIYKLRHEASGTPEEIAVAARKSVEAHQKLTDAIADFHAASKNLNDLLKRTSPNLQPTSTSDIAYAAKELGFDGVIFRDVRDTADNSDILGDVFLVYDSKQIKDLRAEKFDPKSPNIFYQLGPSAEDKAAFEQAARGVAGVDMSGSAEAVEERKRDMRKIGEDLKDQVKGASTAGINVLEAEDAKDLNFLLRWLAPPGVWAKKFPAVHKVWRQGVKAEIDQSIYIQRMNREWDTITRPLSKAQFEQLTGLMFLGDAQETTFTDEDLDEFGVPAKVQTAYKGARRFIDKLGRWTEQHERNMKLDLVKRRSKLLREMATQRGMELQEFRKLYRARAALKESMRHGRGDPDDLAVKIEEADRKLHGRLREDMLGDETTAYFDMAEEADRLEVRLERTVIRKREGYVPHKFFGSWEIRSYQPDLADEAGASYERVGSEEGNFPSRLAAIRAARQYAKKHPDRKIVVLPREFQFPDSKATVLTQGSFDMLRNQVQDLMKVEGEELQDLMEGVARPRNRRRHAGFAQYRKGVPGFDKKLDRVIRAHIGEVVRYTTLDRLKYDAITMMEKEGLQRSRVTQERPELQKAVEAFLRDVNGQKQPVEEQVDTILNRPWATPLRVGLAAGGTAFLVAGGATTSVISGGLIGSYVGWRVAKSLASGGEFPSRAITAGMLSDMSHLKLGMVTNLMSALVNMTQTTLNTYPTLGARDTGAGIRRLQKALMSHVRGKPNKDWKILVKNDMNPAFGFNEGTKNQFQKESILSKMSMLAFTSAEGFNRSVAMLGAINRAERQGLSWGQAVQAGRRAAERTQFHYGPANKPELLRGNFLRVPLQFKNFIAQQMSFVLGLRGAEVPRFLLAMFLTAGALGIPGLDALDWLMEVMFDWSPIAAIKEGALEMAAKGELESGLGQLIARGMPGLGGIDISGRTGMGEKFLPMQIRDFTGPWISTVTSAARHAQEGAAITDQIRNLSPGLGNPLKAIEAAGAGGQMTSPWKRGRPEMVYSDAELIAKGVGARPVREAMEMDWREVNRIKLEKIRRDERRNVDRATAALKRGDRMGLIKIMREAQEAGIPIRASQLRSSMRGMQQQRAERTLRMLPRSLRGDAMELRRGLDRAAEGAAR